MCAGGLATFASPLATLARVPSRNKFVFVLLRGGLDGLAAVVPIGDPNYSKLRQRMAFTKDQIQELEQGLQLVIAVGAPGADMKREVDLRGREFG